MMTRIATGSFLAIALLSPSPVAGFEEETHRALSRTAYDLSSVSSVLHSIYGIASIDTFKGRLPFFLTGQPRTAAEWVTFGGSEEDVPAWRVLNHFYDPISGAGTDILGAVPAPDWALEEAGDLAGQEHSYKDARNAFYNGLTRRTREGRERELGHAFYALGHVIHMIQDMAQPQHTRGDLHPPYTPLASFIEEYVDDNILSFTLGGARIPNVARARDLWTTGRSARGLADFSNAHFVSAGTNFTALQDGATAERYRSPRLDLALRDIVAPPDSCRDGVRAPGPLTYFVNTFPDPIADIVHTNTRMTTYSVFDQHLIDRGRGPVFALNCFNIDAAGDLLLPRAVSYSAALLQYFFRGRLEARSESTADRVRFRVVNRTPGETMSGAVELLYDTITGDRRKLGPWDVTVEFGAESEPLESARPTDSANPGQYLLVFRGRLGEEPDAVAGRWARLVPKPVILVGFAHQGFWALTGGGGVSFGGRYAVNSPTEIAEMEYFRSYDGYCYTDAWSLKQYCFRFGAIEATYYWLVSALVPEDPTSPLALRAVPPHFVRSVEIDPAPAFPDNPGAFTNYATPPTSGVSWVSGATTWRLKLLWADDVASWPESAEVLGYDAQGQVDRSPRVVKVCPGQEYGPGLTRFPFGPNELRHPSIYHCPGWDTFDDPSLD